MFSTTALVALLLALLHTCALAATAQVGRQAAVSPLPSLTTLPTATATATTTPSTTQTQTTTATPTRTPALTPSSSPSAPSQTPPVASTPRAPVNLGPDADEEDPLITPDAEPSEGPSNEPEPEDDSGRNNTVGYVVAAIVLVVIVLGALFAIYGINLTSAAPPETYTAAAGTGGVPEAVGMSPVQVSP